MDCTDVALLKEALVCEKAAPEILPFKESVVDRVSESLAALGNQIQSLEKDPASDLTRTLYQYEESRTRYMLRSYHRVRIMKIESYIMNILDDDECVGKLSIKERQFAEDYLIAVGGHLKSAVLNHLPQTFNSLVFQSSASNTKDMVPAPNLDSHCFCRVLEDLGNIDLQNDGEMVQFNKDDIFVVRYRPIKQYLEAEKIELV